ncbi:DgyrCDS2176 [Dimorphilus gyrociliatus]|uniref:DgyrCDS2176 n=1 Tax=Dimorphilus gyrociliatus TaxID=2664684 RepID=A0A7I8VEK4_9ANNE|nr:DgyrCDS2176 [Dimorphilus gyrociliatus]
MTVKLQITEDRKNVFSVDLPDDEGSELSRTMRDHLRSLVQERDFYVDEMKNLTTTVDELCQAQVEIQRQPKAAPSPERQNSQALELAENKAKLRKVRQELEERTEQIHEYVEELDILQKDLNKIKQENRILIQDARSARTYRDELDVWKEKAQRFEKYEAENEKLRNKLNEFEYFKTRVEELREDNRILDETRTMLEEKLDGSSKRVERVMELENDLIKYKEKFDMICKVRAI